MEYLLQVLHFITPLFHFYLVFPKAKDLQLNTSGQEYTHSHRGISQVWGGKKQKKEMKKTWEISLY